MSSKGPTSFQTESPRTKGDMGLPGVVALAISQFSFLSQPKHVYFYMF